MHEQFPEFTPDEIETVTPPKRVTVFEPSPSKDPFEEFPELKNIAEFSDLTSGEFRFVYFYANRTSDLYEQKPKNVKISKCFDRAFGKDAQTSMKQQYLTEMFPERVMNALQRMRAVDPDIRMRAKSMVKKIFHNYEALVSLANQTTMDVGKAKDYVALTKTVVETLPGLVEQMEHPFGVKEKRASTDDRTEENIFDQVMKNS